MVNHRTGDKCVLTFKPRGWRGKDVAEIVGVVMDKNERVTWEIAGRWSSQLVARPAGSANDTLLPDVSVGEGQSSRKYLLLWQNTVKPTAPFNLTPFAITLNDCPGSLAKWLPPTDCRLRQDMDSTKRGTHTAC